MAPTPLLRSHLAARADARGRSSRSTSRPTSPRRTRARLRDTDHRRPRPARRDDAARASRRRSPTRTSRSTTPAASGSSACSRRDFWIDPDAVLDRRERDAARGFAAPSAAPRSSALRETLAPPAGRLLRLFTGLDGGVKLLVDLRADLLQDVGGRRRARTGRRELYQHLATLFDVGLLSLQRITWDSPASLLEKLIAYEAVHAIDSWTDLKNRLDSDRRCYALLPSRDAGRAARVRRDRADDRDRRRAPEAARRGRARPRPRTRRHRGLLFDLQLPARPRRASTSATRSIKEVVEQLTVDLPHVQRFVTLVADSRDSAGGSTRSSAPSALSDRERELLPAEPARVRARLADEDWGYRRSDQARAAGALRRAISSTAARRACRSIPSPTSTSRTARRSKRLNWLADPSPCRSRPLGRPHGELPLRARRDRRARRAVRTGRRSARTRARSRDLLAE